MRMSKRSRFYLTNHELLENITDAVLFVSLDGTILQANKAARKLIGEQQEIKNIDRFLDFSLLTKQEENRLIMRSKIYPKLLLEVISVKFNEQGFYLILNQVTLNEEIPEVKKYIDELITTRKEGLLMFDLDGNIIDCEQPTAAIFHYTDQEVKSLSLSDLVHRDDEAKLFQFLTKEEEYVKQFRGITKNNEEIYVNMTKLSLTKDLHGVVISHIKDITDQTIAKKRMKFLANYDYLTKLPNRHYFFNVLEKNINQGQHNEQTFAILHIHLNHLKQINESFGYEVGDRLLKKFSQKLQQYISDDIFVARLNSNEFIMLYEYEERKQSVEIFVEHLLGDLKISVQLEDYDVKTSVNIGISLYPKHGVSADELLKKADAALYIVRESEEKSYNFYESSLSRTFNFNLKMESELHKALANEQFELHYQPQKCLKTGEVIGVEALLRWNHPVKGIVPPLEFIPLAEKTDLIIDIGRWVLYEACKQNKRWQNQGYKPVIVSVNLSTKQLHQKDFVQDVETVLQKTKLAPKYLELEITESMAMTNESYVLQTIKRLRQLGIHVSIDDFGTGYSSLKSLSFLPVTKLKIDKMFMDESKRHNRTIVRSIIRLSHSLNLKVIAEGVETYEQLSFLKEENCDQIQGFYLSKPVPAPKLLKFLRTV